MTPKSIATAAKQTDLHKALDCLEAGATTEEYYRLNHASPEMRKYLATCLRCLTERARVEFIGDWLRLIKKENS